MGQEGQENYRYIQITHHPSSIIGILASPIIHPKRLVHHECHIDHPCSPSSSRHHEQITQAVGTSHDATILPWRNRCARDAQPPENWQKWLQSFHSWHHIRWKAVAKFPFFLWGFQWTDRDTSFELTPLDTWTAIALLFVPSCSWPPHVRNVIVVDLARF